MKLLVFAHTPPPHHGQSRMVQLMLEGLSENAGPGDSEIGVECFHVNARFSADAEDIGAPRLGKFFLLLWFCLQAISLRISRGVRVFYYIPAPPKRAALYRDWLVMLLCRPWFRRVIFHWHAAGLGEWLEKEARPWEAWVTRRLMGGVSMAVVVTEFNRDDAMRLKPRSVVVVENGVPDPCPDFDREVLPLRTERLKRRLGIFGEVQTGVMGAMEKVEDSAHSVRVLFVGLCTRDKGLFDAVNGVLRANKGLLNRESPVQFHLTIAGDFMSAEERREFQELLKEYGSDGTIRYAGFVTGEEKARLFRESDIFCFPTYYLAESFGLVLVEAMAYGLPTLVTRWRSLPGLVPSEYPGLVEPRRPDEIAATLVKLATYDAAPLRREFLDRFTREKHLANLRKALLTVERPVSAGRR